MVIFNSYVELPEGNHKKERAARRTTQLPASGKCEAHFISREEYLDDKKDTTYINIYCNCCVSQ